MVAQLENKYASSIFSLVVVRVEEGVEAPGE